MIEHDAASLPIKESDAQALFQAGDGAAEAGLRDVKLFCSLGDVARAGDSLKIVQL